MDLQDRVAIVTGGSGGLGQRICRALASNSVHVVVNYAESEAKALGVARELTALGPRAIALQADVTDPAQVARMVWQANKEFGRIDILVNDAAFNAYVPFKELDNLTLDLWHKILETNLTGPFVCTKAVAPLMKAQGQGRIVNISSGAGFRPRGSSIAYAVSKAGINHLTMCMAVALAPEVLVNCVAPGFMEGTRMTENLASAPSTWSGASTNSLKRAVDKDDVARQVVELCRTDSTTGHTVLIDCGRF